MSATFLKQNWFKICMLVLVLLGVGILYFALVEVPEKRWIAKRISECKKAAKGYAEKQERDQGDVIYMAQAQESTYSQKDQRCVASVKLPLSQQTKYEYHLVDPESGQELSVYWYDYASDKPSEEWRVFEDIYEKYFGTSPRPGQ